MADKESIIDRIKKLRALAGSSNPHEAAAAAAAAAKLIDAHQLSEAELLTSDSRDAVLESEPIMSGKVMAQWRTWLATSLCKYFGVFMVRDRTRGALRIWGRPTDVEVVREMFSWLCDECERLSRLSAPKGGGVAWHTTFKNGCATTICVRLDAMKREREASVEVKTAAMVHLEGRLARAEAAATASIKYKTVKHRPSWGSDVQAYAAGLKAGKDVHLGAQLAGGDGSARTRELPGRAR